MTKFWLSVFLTVSVASLALGQGGKGGKDGKGSGTGGMNPPRTRDDVCTDAKLNGELEQAEIDKIKAVEVAPEKFTDILPFICKIPEACLRRIGSMGNETLEASDIKSSICLCGESRNLAEVIRVLVRRYNRTQLCTDIIVPTLNQYKTSFDQCKLGHGGLSVLIKESQKKGDFEGCTTIPSIFKLFWSRATLEEHLNAMTKDEFKSLLIALAAAPDMIRDVPCENKKLIGKIFTAKDILTLDMTEIANNDNLAQLVPLMPLLPAEVCEQIPYLLLIGIGVEQLKELDWGCDSQGRGGDLMCGDDDEDGEDDDDDDDSGEKGKGMPSQRGRSDNDKRCGVNKCGPALVKNYLAGKAVEIDQYATELGKLACCVDQRTMLGGAAPGKCGKIPRSMNPKVQKEARDKCKPQKPSKDLTKDDVLGSGCVFIDMFESAELSEISVDAMCDAQVKEMIKKCTNGKVPQNSRQKIRKIRAVFVEKCLSGNITAAEVQEAGDAIFEAKCESVKNVKAAKLPDVARESMNPAKMACWKATMDNMDAENVAVNSAVLDAMTAKETGMKSKARKTQILNDVENTKYDPAKKRAVLKEFLDGKNISNLTEDERKQLGKIITGLSPEQINNSIPDNKKQEIYEELCKYDELRGRQIRAATKIYLSHLRDSYGNNPVGALTADKIDELSDTCLLGFVHHAKNLSMEALEAFCSRLTEVDLDRLVGTSKSEHRHKLANLCYDAIGDVKNLIVLLSKENLDEMTAKDLTAVPSSAMQCTMKNVTEYIIQKLATLSDAEFAESELTLWMAYAKRDSASLDKDNLAELLVNQVDSEECSKMQTDEQRAYFDNVISVLSDLATEEPSTRRKRAVTTTSCVVLSGYTKQILMQLDVSSITAIEDFSGCIETFGVIEWSSAQLAELRKKYDAYLDQRNICDLTASELQDIGSIAYSMTEAEIGCLKNLDLDALMELGARKGWTTAQAKALLDRYMTLANITPASYNLLSGSELAAAGHLLCGLSGDTNKINPATFKDVARTLGTIITMCNTQALQGLYEIATHADAFGPLKDWTPERIDDLGIIAAAIPADEMSGISEAHIEFLSNSALEHIPGETLKKMSKDQLLSLDDYQLIYVNMDDLSASQKDILSGGDGTTSDDDSGGRTVVMSGAGLMVALLTCLIM